MHDQPDARRVLERAAATLGTRATLADSSAGLLLCLADPIRFEQARRHWTFFYEVDPLGELAGTLAAGSAGGVELFRPGHGPATASFRATGGYNPLRAAWTGPYAGSIYVRDHERPRSLPTVSWPRPPQE